MAQMADHARPPYPPPPQDYHHPAYAQQHSPPAPRQDGSRDDNRSAYPPPPDHRQGQYPPAPYPPPQQWAGHPQGHPYPPPPHHYDPNQPPPQYHYPPPPAQPNHGPAPHDPYRLPPPPHVPYPYYAQHYPQQPPHAPRQRTAIACKYCRKRKVCLFHPVSSQAAFVPAAALYAANGQRPPAQDGPAPQGNQPPMLYGAHGQPLGPAGPNGQPQYSHPPSNNQAPPPQGYVAVQYPGYGPSAPGYGHSAPPVMQTSHYDQSSQHPPPPQTASSDRSDRGSLKRGPPDDESRENGSTSPRPSTKPRHSGYDMRPYDHQGPTSPAGSTMSYQSYPPSYGNGPQPVKGNNSPPAGLTPNSAHSLNSPHAASLEGKTPPPMPGSAGSSQNGRSNMKVHEMLSNPSHSYQGHDQRGKGFDNDMLNKLDGKK
ncbi:hypothetical protein LTS08_002240 [Lithohypha guttulata]|uniref:uncharacterized protein n=1 Tax=Lithohypha guttulata TaxID=1690604 RepID=UPI002DDDCCA4|nr:hypothetical protein LTS08_002240 [Lithohypha guttulata]